MAHNYTTAGDKRPTFQQIMDDYELTPRQLAVRTGVAESWAYLLYSGQPLDAEKVDRLLAALSDMTGHIFTRAEVRGIVLRLPS